MRTITKFNIIGISYLLIVTLILLIFPFTADILIITTLFAVVIVAWIIRLTEKLIENIITKFKKTKQKKGE